MDLKAQYDALTAQFDQRLRELERSQSEHFNRRDALTFNSFTPTYYGRALANIAPGTVGNIRRYEMRRTEGASETATDIIDRVLNRGPATFKTSDWIPYALVDNRLVAIYVCCTVQGSEGSEGSGSGSGSGSEGSGSGSGSEGSGSEGSGGSGSGTGFGTGIHTCCEVELGPWPAAFPTSLNAAITSGCCAGMNTSFEIFPFGATPTYQRSNGARQCNLFTRPFAITCSGNEWRVSIPCQTNPGHANGHPAVLVSCDPFHLVATVPIAEDPIAPSACCDGTAFVEVTE